MLRKPSPGRSSEPFSADASRSQIANLLSDWRPYIKSMVERHFFSRLSSRFDSSDIVHDTMVRAMKDSSGFLGSTEREFAGWLRRIVLRRIIDLLRQCDASSRRRTDWARQHHYENRRLEHPVHSGPAGECALNQAEQEERRQRVMQAVQQLPEDYRDIILLRHFSGLTLADAAHRMGRSVDSAEKLWARGLARLRPLLRDIQ